MCHTLMRTIKQERNHEGRLNANNLSAAAAAANPTDASRVSNRSQLESQLVRLGGHVICRMAIEKLGGSLDKFGDHLCVCVCVCVICVNLPCPVKFMQTLYKHKIHGCTKPIS